MTQLIEAVEFINRCHHTSYRLGARFPGGTRGAYELTSDDGQRAVLKCATHPQRMDQLQRSVRVVERLRAVSYPAPAYLFVGALPDGTPYYVQQFVQGSPLVQLIPPLLDQILALNDLQRGHHLVLEQNWSTYVQDVVFSGESGWADTLRSHSASTAELLAAVELVVRPYMNTELPTEDIVHGDFNPDNVLVNSDRVTAIIDLEAAGCGSRAIDLAVLLGWGYEETAPAERDRIISRIAEIVGPAGLAVCLGYQILNMVAYAATHFGRAGVEQHVRRSWQMLNDARSISYDEPTGQYLNRR